MPKIAIFDIDNTLTESRSPISPALAKTLSELIDRMPVALITGGSLKDMESQVVRYLFPTKMSNLFLLPTEGAELQRFDGGTWRTVYSHPMEESKRRRIIEEISKMVKITPANLSAFVEDRGNLIAYHALGRDADIKVKYAWDPIQEKRKAIMKDLGPLLPDIFMAAAGSTTINFTENGINKAYGVSELLKHLDISHEDAIFVGDALGEGGNDAPVKGTGVKTIATTSPEVTREIVIKILQEAGKASDKISVAFFCSEYGVEDDIALYAGGLGILAGDMVKEIGKRPNVDFHAFGLIFRKGMKTSEGKEEDYTEKLVAAGFRKVLEEKRPLSIKVPIGRDHDVAACVWHKRYGRANLYLLDADMPENSENDRSITDYLYDLDKRRRVYQEILLGLGSAKLLSKFGISPDAYHFNEGHMGFSALGCIVEHGKGAGFAAKAASMRQKIAATKHTILSGAGTYLSREEFMEHVSSYLREAGCDPDEVFEIGGLERNKEMFSTTKFLIKIAGRSNGVSVSHVAAEKVQYPGSPLVAITNGVDIERWQSPSVRMGSAARKDPGALGEAKTALREELVEYVNKKTGSSLRGDRLTIVWARRFASYKRPGLLFGDEQALRSLVNDLGMPIQVIVAGKAHPMDMEGVRALSIVEKIVEDPAFGGRVAYLPEYTIQTAKILVRGADVWLNTPIPGFEACGTSGMKAGLNGTLVFSTNDGWVAEEPKIKDVGFMLGEEGIEKKIYETIKEKIAPCFYGGGSPGTSEDWLSRMQGTISLAESRYGIGRMVDEYIEKMYNHVS